MLQGYHTLVPGVNSIFLETVWVPLIFCSRIKIWFVKNEGSAYDIKGIVKYWAIILRTYTRPNEIKFSEPKKYLPSIS